MDIQKTADRWLNTRNRLLVRFHPEKSTRGPEVALDRAKEPALGADRNFRAPDVKTAKLENGMDVFVVERPDLPKVAVTLATRAGSVSDTQGKGARPTSSSRRSTWERRRARRSTSRTRSVTSERSLRASPAAIRPRSLSRS